MNNRQWQSSFTVAVEHTDCTGVVYHAKYMHFLEAARSEVLAECCSQRGVDVRDLYQRDGFFVVRSVNINYIKPMRLAERGVVQSRFQQVSPVRSRWIQMVVSQCYGHCCVEAEIDLVFVGSGMRPKRVPQWLTMHTVEER